MIGREIRTTIDAAGKLDVTLEEVAIPEPAEGEVVVRVEATPLNPSDMGVLLGPVDVTTLRAVGGAGQPRVEGEIPLGALASMRARIGQSLRVGNEGAGVVVRAGKSAESLEGKVVATRTYGMYAQYRVAKTADCIVMPEGTTPREAASAFINPLTVLAMVETLRREGHTALVHTAAASNVGHMLQRLCNVEGIPLVNVVRSRDQARALEATGARHIVDSSLPTFDAELTEAVAATGATLAFDAIGGGTMAARILAAMEAAALRKTTGYLRYGTPVAKQVYVYGALDTRPTEVARTFGMAWGIGGWLMTWQLLKSGAAQEAALRERVAREIRTTFATTYGAEIGLADLADPEVLRSASRRATGAKVLVNPQKGA